MAAVISSACLQGPAKDGSEPQMWARRQGAVLPVAKARSRGPRAHRRNCRYSRKNPSDLDQFILLLLQIAEIYLYIPLEAICIFLEILHPTKVET